MRLAVWANGISAAVFRVASEDFSWSRLKVIRCLDLQSVMEERPN
jgi:hypothetical protein